jgi:hypothetical protein
MLEIEYAPMECNASLAVLNPHEYFWKNSTNRSEANMTIEQRRYGLCTSIFYLWRGTMGGLYHNSVENQV